MVANILRAGLEAAPRGPSCFARHSALSPMPTARESDPTTRGKSEIFHKFDAVVMAAAVGFEPTDRVFPAKVRPDQAIISRPR
jgi:hypothetical protein